MVKCICIRACQVRIDGLARYFHAGEVRVFKECPPHWRPIETVEVDFLSSPREVLMETEWSFKEAQEVIKKAYGFSLVKEAGTKKSDIVDQILEARL